MKAALQKVFCGIADREAGKASLALMFQNAQTTSAHQQPAQLNPHPSQQQHCS